MVDDDGSSDTPTVFPSIEEPKDDDWAYPKRAVILMDAFSPYHGGYLAQIARDVYGVAIINVWSDYIYQYFRQKEDESEIQSMAIPKDLEGWKNHGDMASLRIEAVICESDSGLPEAEVLGEKLGLRKQNGFNEGRRDKYLMNEAARKAGLPTVEQKLCRSLEEALEFAKELQQKVKKTNTPGVSQDQSVPNQPKTPMCVVKPIRGVASENVFLCCSPEEVRKACDTIFGSVIFGSPREKHDTVLVQEFATGKEYAIDVVSRDGEHKVAALWRYDKRSANGASFVYFATELLDGHASAEADAVCAYIQRALDALGVKWGLTHNEVILTSQGPRLVEVNCRQHNMDFAPITMACIGYNALDMQLAAYLDPKGDREGELVWELLPDRPVTRALGAMVHLVNYQSGRLVAPNVAALQEIQEMSSVLDLEVYPSFLEAGEEISPTIDIRTDAGWVQLINDDEEAFRRDYDRIVELMPTLFETKEP